METWATHLITFLVGTATGASGNYFASKYTDQRREKEEKIKESDKVKKIISIMAELIKEMKEDFNNPDLIVVRELVVLPNKRVIFNDGGVNRFYYFEDEHADLKSKISILENHGFLVDVTHSNVPIFRISEHFWEIILKL